jgi:hypothetical protein
MYKFEKSLKKMSVLELMKEYSHVEYLLAEGGTEWDTDQLQDCIEQLEKEALSRN